MIRLQPQLRCHAAARREARAVMLPGSDPAEWLRQITTWDVAASRLNLAVLPLSPADRMARGLIVRFPADAVPRRDMGALYGEAGRRLLIPVEATLAPDITETELHDQLGPSTVLAVWHPLAGLVKFEKADLFSIETLLQPPAIAAANWNRARVGLAFNDRVTSLLAVWPDSPEEMLQQAGGDIGSKQNDLPELTGKTRRWLDQIGGLIGQGMLRPAAYLAKGLEHLAPSTASEPTWINKLGDWADKILGQPPKFLNSRARELQRLMRMLNESPDEGLKYAIPMNNFGGGQQARDRSSQLGQRQVDFNMGRMFGSGPTDYWGMPPEYQQKLTQRYRELAERELRLGRHRRAAFIFAELLGDLTAAAGVLTAGKHFREAAVLYRDKLKRPLEAAQCLEQGGLLHEAIPLYRDLKRYETVGDLHARLGEEAEARGAWRAAVHEYERIQLDHLGAARVLDEKLSDVDQSLLVLGRGWQSPRNAKACLDQWFVVTSRLGRHDVAIQEIARLKHETDGHSHRNDLVEVLGSLSSRSPDGDVRHAAMDAARVVTASSLEDERHNPQRMLAVISSLTPEDRLVQRDVQRFQTHRQPSMPRPVVPPKTKTSQRVLQAKLLRVVPLAGTGVWTNFAGTKAGVCAVRQASQQIVVTFVDWNALLRGDSNSKPVSISYRRSEAALSAPIVAVDDHVNRVHLSRLGGKLELRRMSFTGSGGEWTVGAPACATPDMLGMAACEGVVWTCNSLFALTAYNQTGAPISSRQLVPLASELERLPPMHATWNSVFIGLGTELRQVTGEMESNFSTGAPIMRLAGTNPRALPRVAAFHQTGGAVIWPDLKEPLVEALPTTLERPGGVFLRSGKLIVHAKDRWQAYITSHRSLEYQAEIQGIRHEPVDVVAHGRANIICVCTSDGRIAVYELPVE